MNLRNLKYFCAAYEAGSTVAAARACHVTQPAISGAIAALEEELGCPLFVRQQRGLSPTPAGIRLFRLGGKLLADAQAIVESFQDTATHPRWSVSVHPSISVGHVQKWLQYLRREIPHLALSVVPQDAQADAHLTPRSCAGEGCQFLPLWAEQYALLTPCDHPLAVQPQVDLADLHGVAFIERTQCELSSYWHAGLSQFQVVPDVRARVDSQEWALGLVAAGVGVTLAPLHPLDRLDGVHVRQDVPQLQGVSRQVGLAYRQVAENSVLASVLALSAAWAGPTMAALHQGAVSSVG